MKFLEFIDRTDNMELSLNIDDILAYKRVDQKSMVIGEDKEVFTAIRCSQNRIYEVTDTYDVVKAKLTAALN